MVWGMVWGVVCGRGLLALTVRRVVESPLALGGGRSLAPVRGAWPPLCGRSAGHALLTALGQHVM